VQLLDADLVQFLVFAWWVFFLLVSVFLAVRVFEDARTRRSHALAISPGLWLAIGLAFPGIGAFGYWIMHHSSIAARRDEREHAAV